METTYSFGYWVRRQRKALDLTQRALAEQVGCALITIKKIEADQRRPSEQMAERLADFLSVTDSDRADFMAAARGERPVDRLRMAVHPLSQSSQEYLPHPTTPLVGRETELTEVINLLAEPDKRLVTIVGPGGMGKTRLALAVAITLAEAAPRPFSGGIFFVDLAPLLSFENMTVAVAGAVGFEFTGQDSDHRALTAQLLKFLAGKEILLLMDNFESVPDGALWIKALLPAAPRLKVLVTSRERLNLSGEQLLPLSGLPYADESAPDPASYPAAALFLARARHIRPDLSLSEEEARYLGQICRLAEGMPLALELTAAWVDMLSLAGIAAKLEENQAQFESDLLDLPSRHRSLRTVWETTWQRLTVEEQEFFSRLCLFRGGFTHAAAAAVAGVTLPILGRLVRKYLITLAREEERYTIHELLRQYGVKRLEAAGHLMDGRQRHFAYFLSLAETAEAQIHGPKQAAWLDQLDAEQGNLRQALKWGLRRPENNESVARLIFALSWHWRIRSQVVEGSSWLRQALDREDWPPTAQALLLFVAGHMAWMRGEFNNAQQLHKAGLALWLEIDGATGRVANLSRHGLGMAAQMAGDDAGAITWLMESLAGFQALDDEWGMAFALDWLGMAYHGLGDHGSAEASFEESLVIGRRLGDNWLLGLFISHAALIAWEAGDLDRTLPLAQEARGLSEAAGHTHSLGQMLALLGQIAAQQGERGKARQYYFEALAMFDEMGQSQYAADVKALLEKVA